MSPLGSADVSCSNSLWRCRRCVSRRRLINRTPMLSRSAAGHRAFLATSRTGGRAASAFAESGATSTRRLSRSRTLFGTPLPVLGSPASSLARDFRGAAAVVGSRTPVMTEHPTRRRNFHRAVGNHLDEPSNETNICWPPGRTHVALARTRVLHKRHHLPRVATGDDFAGENEGQALRNAEFEPDSKRVGRWNLTDPSGVRTVVKFELLADLNTEPEGQRSNSPGVISLVLRICEVRAMPRRTPRSISAG